MILNDSSVFGPIEVYGTIKTKTCSSLQNILTMHDGSVMENLNVVSYNHSEYYFYNNESSRLALRLRPARPIGESLKDAYDWLKGENA